MILFSKYINEKLKIDSQSEIISNYYIIIDDEDREIKIEKSKNKYKNQCFEWIAKHCIVPSGLEGFNLNVDNFVIKCTSYEVKNNFFSAIYLIDKNKYDELCNSWNIKNNYKKLFNKYSNDEYDGIIGYVNLILTPSQRNKFRKRGTPSSKQRSLDDVYEKINDKIWGYENKIVFIPESSKTFSDYGVLWAHIESYPIPLQKNHPNKA